MFVWHNRGRPLSGAKRPFVVWDELAIEEFARPVDATHLQHDQLKLLKLLG
jgi:hypothetical protein